MRFDHALTLAMPAYRGGSHGGSHYHYHSHTGYGSSGGGGGDSWGWIILLVIVLIGICVWAYFRQNSED
ncbi:hypothetical protein [Streptomyces odontomachi]|uniref:hypothetical protein n=1 Tax=Streptomyces odontomachi TaxID=2944940 RepID=UPI00210C8311|nr:hypothetical protein [Streptomyces sp. ODS25]